MQRMRCNDNNNDNAGGHWGMFLKKAQDISREK